MKRDRIEDIAQLLDKRGKMTLDQLDECFPDVSQMTLRRDLFLLEQQGRLIRVRGGAMSVKEVQKISGEPYTKKTTLHTDEKIIIAQKAASLIDEGISVFLDGGTTAMYLAKEIPDINLHVFTNGLAVAIELVQKKNISVTMIGGQVMRDNLSTASPVARDYFNNTNFEVALLSTSAFTPEQGFSCSSQVEADLLKMVRKKTKSLYMMLDTSKAGKINPYTFAGIDDVDVLITDNDLPADIKQLFTDRNIVVM